MTTCQGPCAGRLLATGLVSKRGRPGDGGFSIALTWLYAVGRSKQQENHMPQQILQVNLKFSIPRADLSAAWLDAAQPIADTPGLTWKVWLMNEAEHEAGGIYLFESKAAAQSYMAGPIVAALKASPAVSNISAKLFDVLEDHSAITRAPLRNAVGSVE
jgi:hypothetical protein